MNFFVDIISYTIFALGTGLLFLGTVVNVVETRDRLPFLVTIGAFYGVFIITGFLSGLLSKTENKAPRARLHKAVQTALIIIPVAVPIVIFATLRNQGWIMNEAVVMAIITGLAFVFLGHRIRRKLMAAQAS